MLDPPPLNAETYAMPYKKAFRKLLDTSGTATSDSANKLIDSSATFKTDGVAIGMLVENVTDGTYGFVLSVDSETQLTLDSDLFPDGDEDYEVSTIPIISSIDRYLVLKATAIMWRYYRMFGKSDYYEKLAEIELQRQIARENSPRNQRKHFKPLVCRRGWRVLFDWGEPYSSL